jgi:phytoene dehydrogenase-like protein
MNRAVVIGSGHNGLVSANYLAKAGFSVTVLERRDAFGGVTVTEEVLPGFRASACAFVIGLFRDRIVRELDLSRHGLELFQAPDVLGGSIGDGGRHFFMWRDLDRTLRGLTEKFGSGDVERFLQFGQTMHRIGDVFEPYVWSEAPSNAELRAAFERAGMSDLWARYIDGSVADLVSDLYADPLLRGFFAFPGMVSAWGGPHQPGSAYVMTHHALGEFQGLFGQWGFVRGGMGGLTDALVSAARANGVEVRASSGVAQVLVENGKALGVHLDNGDFLAADVVMSAADPKLTLEHLVGRQHLSDSTIKTLDAFDDRGTMARIFFALSSLPRYEGVSGPGEGPEHRGHLLLGPSLESYERSWQAQRAHELPSDPTLEIRIESVLDPQLAPTGQHIMTVGVQQLSYGSGVEWKANTADLVTLVRRRIGQFAPDFESSILGEAAITPLDLARKYGLPGGNIYHGALNTHELGRERPFGTGYRSDVAGLYLGSAGVHPGGGVMGLPGRNAAMAAIADVLGLVQDQPRTRAARASVIDGLLASRLGRKAGVKLASQSWTRSISRRATRKP